MVYCNVEKKIPRNGVSKHQSRVTETRAKRRRRNYLHNQPNIC